jgi:hypothetical protein
MQNIAKISRNKMIWMATSMSRICFKQFNVVTYTPT